MEKKVFEYMNKFRQNPAVIKPTLQKIITTIKRMNPNSNMIQPYEKLAKDCNSFPKVPTIKFSEDLSKAAKDYLEGRLKNKETDEVFLQGDELKGVVPDNFLSENSCLIVSNGYDSPEAAIYKLLCNPEDGDGVGKKFLQSKDVTQVGIAIHEAAETENDDEEEEESYICFIFGADETAADDDFEIEGVDLTELRKAFEIMDYEKKNKINIKKVVQALKEQGKDESEPTLFQIVEELDNGQEYVSWPEFAKHCHGKMSDKQSDEGKERIYKILLPNERYQTIDYSELKDLNEYLNLGYTDKEIQTMLKMSTENKMGISYEDYLQRLEKLQEKE